MTGLADRIRCHLASAPSRRRMGFLLLVLAGLTMVGTSARAYWTSGGAGTASVTTGTLSAPTNVTVLPANSSGSVPVSWTGSSGMPIPQGYYVTRVNTSDSSSAPACNSSPASLITSGPSCTDTGVPDGAFNYTVTAVYLTWTATSGSSSDVAVSIPSRLSFTPSPSSPATSGTALSTQPGVTVQDAGGNTVVTDTSSVTLTLTTPAGAALACTQSTKAAVAGVATFTGCQIDKVGTYTLTATDGSLTSAVSTSVTITEGPATKLAFTTNSSASTGATAFGTQPVVTVQDAGGNTVTTSSAVVALTITPPTGGAVLTCTTNPTNAVSGVATFAGCAVDKIGTYTLTATSAGLTSAISNSFTITVGPATKLAFTTAPSNTAANSIFTTQPGVTVQDAGGNKRTASTPLITLTITTPAGATLTCTTNPKGATTGLATFSGCKINAPGSYTLTATSPALTNAISTSFSISGPATKLSFTSSPSASTGKIAFGTQPVVVVQDAGGISTTGINPVNLAITTPAGATLTCTTILPRSAVSGVATFAGCAVDRIGTYTLTATSAGLTSAVSSSFTITVGPATKLAFTANPSASTGGTAFGTQPVVTVLDAGANTVTSSSAPVALTITPPTGGAVLTCTTNPTNAVSGVATFAGCAVDKIGTYTLTATSAGLTNAISNSFTITVGPATKLVFTANPSAATGGTAFGTQPVVTIRDTGGNNVTTSSASVTLAITNPAGAFITCTTNPTNAVSGVATFAGCAVDKIGTYTLTATSAGLTNAISNSFTITVGPATKLAFTTAPSNTAANSIFTTSPGVTVQDAGGNRRTASTPLITLTITTPAGASLTCTTNPKGATTGLATFSGCKINAPGSYTLTATSPALTNAVSATFTIL